MKTRLLNLWRILSVVLVLVLVPFFFIGGPDWLSPPFFQNAWNLGHIIFFALLALLIQRFIGVRGLYAWIGWVLMAALLGVVIEIVQSDVGRDADFFDVFNDMAGFLFGLVWARPGQCRWPAKCAVAALMIPVSWEVFTAGLSEWRQWQEFPRIAGFEHSVDLVRMRGTMAFADKPVTEGEHSLKISLNTGRYSGASVMVYHGDWSRYRSLSMDVFNPSAEPLPMTLRVNDRVHERTGNAYDDRFNERIEMQPGWNHLEVPLEKIREAPRKRQMDLTDMFRIMIFAKSLPEPRTVYWDNLRLNP